MDTAFSDSPTDETTETVFKVGDVVYTEGSSAIIGDVICVDSEGVQITWRTTTTTEDPGDVVKVPPEEIPCRVAIAWNRERVVCDFIGHHGEHGTKSGMRWTDEQASRP